MASRSGAFVLLVLCSLPVLLAPQAAAGATKPLVPAMFVFGDSLVDVGNNNHLRKCNDSCKANHRPYGVDYPSHSPTGRFSNGYNLADQLGTQYAMPARTHACGKSNCPFLWGRLETAGDEQEIKL